MGLWATQSRGKQLWMKAKAVTITKRLENARVLRPPSAHVERSNHGSYLQKLRLGVKMIAGDSVLATQRATTSQRAAAYASPTIPQSPAGVPCMPKQPTPNKMSQPSPDEEGLLLAVTSWPPGLTAAAVLPGVRTDNIALNDALTHLAPPNEDPLHEQAAASIAAAAALTASAASNPKLVPKTRYLPPAQPHAGPRFGPGTPSRPRNHPSATHLGSMSCKHAAAHVKALARAV